MRKAIEIIKKKENIFILILIFISLIGVSLCINLVENDELWNFQNIYKMYNGFQIYNDANVICTPLFFYLGNLLFNILGANFFVFRIYNIIIYLIYFFLIYKILRKLKINMKYATISIVIFIMLGNYLIPRTMANYNSLALVFVFLGIYLFLRNKCIINTKNIIIQSIICFLVILTKQNIGLFYTIALAITIFFMKKNHKILGVLQEAGILLILSALFVLYLYTNNLLNGFINYTVLGMKQFTSYNTSFSVFNIAIYISILVINLCTSIFLVKQKKILITQDEKNNLFILNCFSISISLMVYPIINISHLLFAINIAVILFIYLVKMILTKSDLKLRKINFTMNFILIILILTDVFINIYAIINWIKEVKSKEYFYNYNEPYFGAVVSDDLYKNIEVITNYIKEKEAEGKDVIIFSPKAALYMVPLKQSNGFYDLPFNGNIGNLDEDDIIKDLIKKEDTLILITNDENNLLWQENKKVVNLIKEKFKYVEDIEEFSVYAP